MESVGPLRERRQLKQTDLTARWWKREMPEDRWCVLHILMNHEKKVAQYLTARTFEHYLPLYRERSRWSDRVVTLERPLFPGYIFVRIAPGCVRSVAAIPGVLRWLGESERDTVSEIEIARIREALAGGCLLRPHPAVQLGNPVRVLRGFFKGAEGVVTDFRRQCEVIIALSATSQCFSLEVGLDDIQILQNVSTRQNGASGHFQALSNCY